jgi:predicted short-subunit dehydrogenase-like oxidoreductase (DUF2520 family)
MFKVVIIGSGNVAQHLILSFVNSKDIDLVQVFSRQKDTVAHLIESLKITNSLSDLVQADLYILAISDDAIASVSSQLPFNNSLVVHTAGSVSLEVLDKKNRRGVFYPLQTFSKNRMVNYSDITICLETEHESDFKLLEKAAHILTDKVQKISEVQRKALHVSAVFVNNFVNYLYQIGQEICLENKLSFDILKPLILETAHKVMTLPPKEAQTGPAIRNDTKTIDGHLQFLADNNQNSIYKTLTQSIQNNGKKL